MAPTEELTDELSERILDAAFAEFGDYGLRRTSIDNVARRAGLARATVYRRFGSKTDLLRAVAQRETRRAMVQMVRAAQGRTTTEDRLVEGFVTGMTLMRANPLMRRLITSEPEMILPLLTTDSQFVLGYIRDFLADQLRLSDAPDRPASPEAAAELIVRLATSFHLAPHSCIPLDTPTDLRTFARTYLAPLLHTTPPPS